MALSNAITFAGNCKKSSNESVPEIAHAACEPQMAGSRRVTSVSQYTKLSERVRKILDCEVVSGYTVSCGVKFRDIGDRGARICVFADIVGEREEVGKEKGATTHGVKSTIVGGSLRMIQRKTLVNSYQLSSRRVAGALA